MISHLLNLLYLYQIWITAFQCVAGNRQLLVTLFLWDHSSPGLLLIWLLLIVVIKINDSFFVSFVLIWVRHCCLLDFQVPVRFPGHIMQQLVEVPAFFCVAFLRFLQPNAKAVTNELLQKTRSVELIFRLFHWSNWLFFLKVASHL